MLVKIPSVPVIKGDNMDEKQKIDEKQIDKLKVSELIDLINADETDDKLYDLILLRLEDMFPINYFEQYKADTDKVETDMLKRIKKLEEKMDKIDNHYLIINKLEILTDLIKKRKLKK